MLTLFYTLTSILGLIGILATGLTAKGDKPNFKEMLQGLGIGALTGFIIWSMINGVFDLVGRLLT